MDSFRTPQKVLNCPPASVQQFYKRASPATFKLINNHIKVHINSSQKNYGKISSSLICETPDRKNSELSSSTLSNRTSNITASTKSFHLFPVSNTPENKTSKRVTNPFEAALSERLHLPLICSPSLFQRPSTPQYSSTNFEWTIEEVSSIGPANVEPHETQFQDSLDPEIEAKAQAAISSFFKEQQIVPSPVDCPLRKHRIVLPRAESLSGNSSAIRPAKRIRDGIAQTVLSIPPNLPKELEEILKPFFNFHENQQQSPTINCDNSNSMKAYHEARDASLRRKLFAIPNMNADDTFEANNDESDVFENSAFSSSPPPKSPDLVEKNRILSEKQTPTSDGFDKNSFGSLSPISKLSSESPNPKRFSSEKHFMNESETECISPIKPSSSPNLTVQQSKINSTSLSQQKLLEATEDSFVNNITNSNLYRSTPDNSMQLKHLSNESQTENKNMSVDSSFNCKISRLLVNSCVKYTEPLSARLSKSKSMTEVDIFNQNEFDEDDMQVSQLSEKSTCSSHSSNADTPRRSRRMFSRKNLSRSFSSPLSDSEEEVCKDMQPNEKLKTAVENSETTSNQFENEKPDPKCEKSVFYRTDSGFNEMANTQDDAGFDRNTKIKLSGESKSEHFGCNQNLISNTLIDEDVSMISCSTPSRKVF